MEFPDLGQHCTESSCRQLDFLPMKCDACDKVFCKDHIRYEDHHCPSAYKKNIQVPVCPLCGQPVPVPRGETPDIKVSEHIDRDCQSDPAKKKRKAYANRCSVRRCKQRELMPVVCSNCRLNFCLRHRHQQDHDCKGFQGTGKPISDAGYAAFQRQKAASSSSSKPKSNVSRTVSKPPQQTYLSSIGSELNRERQQRREQSIPVAQNNMSEDEALARALALSLSESRQKPLTQEEHDLALARQLQEEEEENRNRIRREDQRNRRENQRRERSNESSCKVS